jgi:hypothetical protein
MTPPAYVRGFHLLPAQHAVSSVLQQRLKVARLSEVNDPFELLGLDCLKMVRRQALSGFRTEQDKKIGLLSFSRAWSNPVLWSHYADGHKGMCLGFDLDPKLGLKGLQEVKYGADKLKLADDVDPATIPPHVQEALLVTKFRHWEYEEELRAFVGLSSTVRESGLFFYPFGDGMRLREVILGPLCPASWLEPLREAVRGMAPQVLVSKARLGFKYFEVKNDGRYPPK